jgi:ParB-like chromosome segregation protein Spo0J
MPAITELMPDDIVVRDRLRELNPDIVERLKESIGSIGLKTPLSVRFLNDDEGYQLVTGRNRLQAAIELGMAWVPVREETGSELDARMWEIAENLHRAELTALEQSEHISEWIKLAEERDKAKAQAAPLDKPSQLETVSVKKERSIKGGRGRKGGVNAAAREFGLDKAKAHRAAAIAEKLDPEAKAEAKVLHLDDNQSALLKAAKQPSKEDQIRALREHAAWLNEPKIIRESPAAVASAPAAIQTPSAASVGAQPAAPLSDDAEGVGGSPAPRVSWKPSSPLDFNIDPTLLRDVIVEVKAWHPSDLDYQTEERILDAMGAPRRCALTPLADSNHAIALVPAEWRIVANLGEHAFGSRKAEVTLIKGNTKISASAAYAAVAVTEAALRAWLFNITSEEPRVRQVILG